MSGAGIKVEVSGIAGVQGALQRLIDESASLAPLMRSVAQTLAAETETNFQLQGRPRWDDLTASYKKQRAEKGTWPGNILQVTGRLAASISTASDEDSAEVGSNVVYAAIHQFGGQTQPHTILARYAKSLAFGGKFAKSVKHPGSKMPARPFLPFVVSNGEAVLQPEAQAAVLATANRFIQRLGGMAA